MLQCQNDEFPARMASLKEASNRLCDDAPLWVREIHENRELKVVSHLNFKRITPD